MSIFSSIATEEDSRAMAEIVSIPGKCRLKDLEALRESSIRELDMLIDLVQFGANLQSERNAKSSRTALRKIRRPQTLQRYPWMTLAHLRDFLRFRTRLFSLDDFVAVMEIFLGERDAGRLSIVKVDTAKLLSPGEFGWRMIAVDLRLSTGMLVEHYMTFGTLVDINHDWLHKVYERWRDVDVVTIGEARARRRDAEFSSTAYREAFLSHAIRDIKGIADPRPEWMRSRAAVEAIIATQLGL